MKSLFHKLDRLICVLEDLRGEFKRFNDAFPVINKAVGKHEAVQKLRLEEENRRSEARILFDKYRPKC